jgi:regulator of nonsense transcripts 2
MQPPVMPDNENTTRVTTGTEVSPSSGKETSALEPIWDDEDTKAFYESLPDLRFTSDAVAIICFIL